MDLLGREGYDDETFVRTNEAPPQTDELYRPSRWCMWNFDRRSQFPEGEMAGVGHACLDAQ